MLCYSRASLLSFPFCFQGFPVRTLIPNSFPSLCFRGKRSLKLPFDLRLVSSLFRRLFHRTWWSPVFSSRSRRSAASLIAHRRLRCGPNDASVDRDIRPHQPKQRRIRRLLRIMRQQTGSLGTCLPCHSKCI